MDYALADRYVPARRGDMSYNVAAAAAAVEHPRVHINNNRPFLPTSGPNADMPCINTYEFDGRGRPKTTNEGGEKKYIMRQQRVVDLLMSGRPDVPAWALNATSLRRDDWIQIDTEAQTAYRDRLTLIDTLRQTVQVGGFNGWGKLTYEYDAMSDAHAAVIDMDGMTEATNDAPTWLPRSVPLPFTHSDFYYSDRVLAASRSGGGQGLDVYSAEMAGRRVAELVEDVAIGTVTGPTFGGRASYFPHDLASTWFGLTNYTNRNTKTNFTSPVTGGWVPNTLYNEILAALDTLRIDRVYGRVAVFYSGDYDQYFHQVFSISGGNTPGETLRTMLMKHERVERVELLDRLTSTYTILIVVLDKRYIRFINGMDLTTWQWDTRGGHQKNLKTGVVQVTLPMSDSTGRSGILHGTTA